MPVMKGNTLDFFSHSPAQTRRFGAHLGALVQAGDVILLQGDLGTGKTHFAQGVARGLGIDDVVRSPTFTLVNEHHEGRLPLYHIDLYRVEGDDDIATIGIEEYLDADGVLVVEWPENGRSWLPADALHLFLRYVNDRRRNLRLSAEGPHAQALLKRYKEQAFAVPRNHS